MSDRKPLMAKATAIWLVENTSLSFEQIGEFCGLHVLEIKGIADDDQTVIKAIKGMDPISSGQLTREQIALGENDHGHQLVLAEPKVAMPHSAASSSRKGPRYTPVSRRHDRPNAVLWILRNHPELKDSAIMRLVGTTKPTITQIRDRSHWNSANLVPQDPVTLGLCSQIDLDAEVKKGAKRVERGAGEGEKSATLLPTAATTAETPHAARPMAAIVQPKVEQPREETAAEEEARVFAKLKKLSGADEAEPRSRE